MPIPSSVCWKNRRQAPVCQTPPARRGNPPCFPVELPLRCIAAGCPPGGVVLDPFSGTGTTGLAARRLGRLYLGIDRNPAYHQAARHAFRALSTAAGHGDGAR